MDLEQGTEAAATTATVETTGTETTTTTTATGESGSEQPTTLLTGNDTAEGDQGKESKESGKSEEGQANKEGQEENKPPVPDAPEGYELTFDEGVQVDKELLGNFQTTAHKLGLNTEQAQELASLYAGHVAGAEKAQQQALAEVQRGWEEQIKASPTYKADVEAARKTLVNFGSFGAVGKDGTPTLDPELAEVFNETMIGSHPKVFQMFVEIGKALAEPTAHGSGTGSGGGGLKFYSTMERDQ